MESVLSLFEQTTDGVCAIDASQRIVRWNGSAETLLGCTAAEVIGRHCYDVLGCTDEAGCCFCRRDCPTIRAAREAATVPTRTLQAHPRGGRPRWVNVTTFVMPRRWRGEAAVVHLFRDADRAKSVQDAVERLVANVVQPEADGSAQPSPRPPDDGGQAPLTRREREVLRHLAAGQSTDAIADALVVSISTVRNHIHSILSKLKVHSRLEAVMIGLRQGLI